MEKIMIGNTQELKILKSICELIKSSPYLNEEQKKELINNTIKPFEVVN